MKKNITLIAIIFMAIQMAAQINQTVVVEHFTNTRCGICGSRNPAFYQTLNNYPDVLHIAYHPSSPYATCVFSQHNPVDNDARTNFYGIYGSTPRIVVQGEVIPAQNPLIKPGQIEAKLGQAADYSVTLTKVQRSATSSTITIDITYVSGIPDETVYVYAGLAEEEVEYNAPNGEDVHHDVFRKVIFDDTLQFSNAITTRTITQEYDTHPDWDEEQIYAFAIVHNNTTKTVIQSGSSLTSPSFISSSEVLEQKDLFYPNPSASAVHLNRAFLGKLKKMELYDLLGNKIKETQENTYFDISDLKKGMYFIRVTDMNNQVTSARIIKRNR